jgi:tRNA (guanine37-N1)-methyltransferase
MRIDVVSIFPEYLAPLRMSLLGKAADAGLISVDVHDLREFTFDRHRTVDDTPYGGGPGMVMKPEPWSAAIAAVHTRGAEASGLDRPRWIVPTPSGRPFTQELAHQWAQEAWLAFACGRYEGIDRRVIDELAESGEVDEVSLGDYVLAGGEVAALVMVEAVSRLVPGVLGNAESVVDDSFATGAMARLVEGPVYTKPAEWQGRSVPEVLTSGDHGAIARWRRDQALARTSAVRPDLINGASAEGFDAHDRRTLEALGWSLDDGRWRRDELAMRD